MPVVLGGIPGGVGSTVYWFLVVFASERCDLGVSGKLFLVSVLLFQSCFPK